MSRSVVISSWLHGAGLWHVAWERRSMSVNFIGAALGLPAAAASRRETLSRDSRRTSSGDILSCENQSRTTIFIFKVSDFRPEMEIWPFCACAVKIRNIALVIGTLLSLCSCKNAFYALLKSNDWRYKSIWISLIDQNRHLKRGYTARQTCIESRQRRSRNWV